jgi:hypothetical protein
LFFVDTLSFISRGTAVEHLHLESAVLDREIACVDEIARPVFPDLLFRRRQCVFIEFDLLLLNGKICGRCLHCETVTRNSHQLDSFRLLVDERTDAAARLYSVILNSQFAYPKIVRMVNAPARAAPLK